MLVPVTVISYRPSAERIENRGLSFVGKTLMLLGFGLPHCLLVGKSSLAKNTCLIILTPSRVICCCAFNNYQWNRS